jgi:hypothetical protein
MCGLRFSDLVKTQELSPALAQNAKHAEAGDGCLQLQSLRVLVEGVTLPPGP